MTLLFSNLDTTISTGKSSYLLFRPVLRGYLAVNYLKFLWAVSWCFTTIIHMSVPIFPTTMMPWIGVHSRRGSGGLAIRLKETA